MNFSTGIKDNSEEIIALYEGTFSASEGPEEGKRIGELVRAMLTTTKADDIFVYSMWVEGEPVGCIIFSRMTFADDDRTAFILSPVAVSPDHQRQGIGQALINHGLNALREHGVDIAFTYGDPNYYSKVGFKQITEEMAKAPCPLSYPHGWLAQSLTDQALTPLKGASRCVEALNDPAFW